MRLLGRQYHYIWELQETIAKKNNMYKTLKTIAISVDCTFYSSLLYFIQEESCICVRCVAGKMDKVVQKRAREKERKKNEE